MEVSSEQSMSRSEDLMYTIHAVMLVMREQVCMRNCLSSDCKSTCCSGHIAVSCISTVRHLGILDLMAEASTQFLQTPGHNACSTCWPHVICSLQTQLLIRVSDMQAQRHLHCCGSGHHQVPKLWVARQCRFASPAAS